MDVHELDPRDDRAFTAWYAVVDAVHRELWPGVPGPSRDGLRAEVLAEHTGEPATCLAATDATGTVVGSVSLGAPRLDNTHLVTAELYVHPAHRRRGAGRALLAAVEKRAADAGRTVVLVRQEESHRHVVPSPHRDFALAHGYALAQRDLRSDLAVPVESVRLLALESACAVRARGYGAVTWTGPCPDVYAEDRAALSRCISADIPLGDLDVEPEAWDVDRVRRSEDQHAAEGRLVLSAGAVHRDTGRLVAYTELHVPHAEPERAYQWDTVVLPEHRGHRLGTVVKIANLRRLATVSPATSTVTTCNAEDNRYMIAVNAALGFTVVGASLEWQKRL